MFNEKYDSCLWDNYDGGYCATVNSNHYEMNNQDRPAITDSQKNHEFEQDFNHNW